MKNTKKNHWLIVKFSFEIGISPTKYHCTYYNKMINRKCRKQFDQTFYFYKSRHGTVCHYISFYERLEKRCSVAQSYFLREYSSELYVLKYLWPPTRCKNYKAGLECVFSIHQLRMCTKFRLYTSINSE